MRIGIISDTHIREAEQIASLHLAGAFRGVDLILHAGDIFIPDVLDELERIAPVLAASGDDDYGPVLTDRRVKPEHLLKLEDKTLLLTHDSLQYSSFKYPNSENLKATGHNTDIVVFGHTHYSIIERLNGTLFVNPGSPTDCRRGQGTVIILNLDAGDAQASLLRV